MDQRKDASEFTKAANAKLLEELPFEDQRDFEEATRGMIAPLSTEPVTDKTGRPIWDPSVFAFIEEGSPAPDSVNPSLWRQSQLCLKGGLFKVVDRLYQVRNADISNLTITSSSPTPTTKRRGRCRPTCLSSSATSPRRAPGATST